MSKLRVDEIGTPDGQVTHDVRNLGNVYTFDALKPHPVNGRDPDLSYLIDADGIVVGQFVRTLGYYEPGDGGGNAYEAAPSGTGIGDGGEYIDHPNLDVQLKGIFGSEVSVKQFGAVGDGLSDDTSPIQSAIDYAQSINTSAVLPVSPKGYAVTTLRITDEAGLEGKGVGFILHTLHDWDKSEETCSSPWIKAIGPVNTPVIELGSQSSVSNFRMIDLRQKFSVTSDTEEFNDTQIAIQIGFSGNGNNHGQRIESVSFFGFKEFIKQWVSGSDKQAVEKLLIRDCHGIPFGVGVNIVHSSDTIWIEDCHFNYNSTRGIRDDTLTRTTTYNLAKTAIHFKLGKADGIRFNNVHSMHCRVAYQFYRDAYDGDSNQGGGFAMSQCAIDVCHRGMEFLRDGANGIGGKLDGGQVVPVVYIEGSENCAVYVDNNAAGSGKLLMDFQGVSMHTGGTNPTNLNVGDSNFTGPGSVKAPRYVFEISNANDTVINVTGGRHISYNIPGYDESHAWVRGNTLNVWGAKPWRNTAFVNAVKFGDGVNADEGAFKFISMGEGTEQIQWNDINGNRLAQLEMGGSTFALKGQSGIQIRPGMTADKAVMFDDDTSSVYPFNDKSLQLGRGNFRWSNVYTEHLDSNGATIHFGGENGPLKLVSPGEGAQQIQWHDVNGNQMSQFEMGGPTLAIKGKANIQIRPDFDTLNSVVFSGSDTAVHPWTDNQLLLGRVNFRWKEIFSATGTISTSDEREKQQISDLSDAELRVGSKLRVRRFKFNSAVDKKGDDARWHTGFIAQEVIAAFESEGIDPFEYGAVCYDEWEEESESLDEDGNVISPASTAGNRYGLRHDELYALMMAAKASN